MDSATSMVLESVLSAIFQQLLDKLAFPFLKSLGLPFGVEKETKRLKSTPLRIEALHTDAEERQIREESVRLWLSDLKDVAYDAKDILDELEYIALQSNIEAAPMQLQTRKRKLTDQVPHFFSRFSSNFELGSRIMKIRERLDEIERESNQFQLKVIQGSQIKGSECGIPLVPS
ncbi:putative disease resistance protein RGA1 [Cinnamomum micranthum f. kanehirae]|uniref:Putative disease resistance protein RGA1 n=1 Tax=Cinnamomum micranthum f. kanehirae TaxID=337451 RepID=A0A443NMI2_9MAGN|nr:putative disease resistance protein RGA1 [Cinnamomum micranthum f. kanehirae]